MLGRAALTGARLPRVVVAAQYVAPSDPARSLASESALERAERLQLEAGCSSLIFLGLLSNTSRADPLEADLGLLPAALDGLAEGP